MRAAIGRDIIEIGSNVNLKDSLLKTSKWVVRVRSIKECLKLNQTLKIKIFKVTASKSIKYWRTRKWNTKAIEFHKTNSKINKISNNILMIKDQKIHKEIFSEQ